MRLNFLRQLNGCLGSVWAVFRKENFLRQKLGCQMAYFKTKNPNLGKFGRDLQWSILWSFGVFYGHLVYFVATWYILHMVS
jgi:hypothetical protein